MDTGATLAAAYGSATCGFTGAAAVGEVDVGCCADARNGMTTAAVNVAAAMDDLIMFVALSQEEGVRREYD